MRSNASKSAGFSLIELLITVGISAVVIAAGAAVFASVANARSSKSSTVRIPLGNATASAFFGQDLGGLPIQTWSAPNYARAAEAELLRSVLLSDIQSACAVFVLSRDSNSTFRPSNSTITLTGNWTASAPDTPEAFRALLADLFPSTSAIFTAYRGAPVSTDSRNFSMFVLRPSPAPDTLLIQSIYELDFLGSTSPAGTYAAFRRFAGNPPALTGYYDVFYAEPFVPSDTDSAPFFPPVAAFERRVRAASVEGVPADAFKKAHNRPFYFVWLPNPASRRLAVPKDTTALTTADPRYYYSSMGNRTGLFFVIPMFPSL